MKQPKLFPFFLCLLFISKCSFALINVNYSNTESRYNNPCPAPVISDFSPTSGPENTLITINGSNFNNAVDVSFNGVTAAFTIINDNQITVFAASALNTSATISITSSGGCVGNSTTDFAFIQPNCADTGDIYISEIYDAFSGSYAVIELYNPTSTPIVLDGVYVIDRYGDIGDPTPSHTYAMLGTIAPLDTYIILLGSGSDCPTLVADFTVGTGINDNDEFKLLKNGTVIDVVEAPNERGYSIVRNADAVVPNNTFVPSDWVTDLNETCTNLGSHTADPITTTTIPVITQPDWQTICENENASFTVSVATGTYTYQWKVLNSSGAWVNVVNNATYSGATTNTLSLNNVPISFNNNQYYCEMTSATCNLVTDAAHLFVSNPAVDTISNQTVCDSYVLPTLTNGSYFTGSNGTGTTLIAGQTITISQTIYIYNESGTAPNICSNESSFLVTIVGSPPVDIATNQTACTEYILPTLTNGNYYTSPNGMGTLLNSGESILTTQTIYIYAEAGTAPNICSNEGSFTVTITSNPPVDNLSDQTVCTDFTLPTLTNGMYYTGTNGTGIMLNAGETISTTQTIFIYNEIGTAPNTCSNESSFTITISGTPTVDTISDYTGCSGYTLPTLTHGTYYTGTNGTGTMLNVGETISTTQTIYIYNEIGTAPNTCSNESSFTVTISGAPLVDTIADQNVCTDYVLPTLVNGNYFTGTNGTGTMLNSTQVISTTQTIYIYNESGTAPNICTNESSFIVTIVGTPPVDLLTNQTDCTEYILPTLSNGNYYTGTNGTGTMLNAGETISTTQTIYVYNEIGTAPNTCSNESSFTVTISGAPLVDTLADQDVCTDYTLPTLVNGNYFTETNGTGTPLFAGETISATQTIFIYNESGAAPNTCSNESSFTITIFPSMDFVLTENNLQIHENTVNVVMTNTSISYEYAIDNGSFQSSPLFSGLSNGTHTLYVQDINGCVLKSIQFEIETAVSIHIPLFFTPNNDGENDVWQITDTQNTIKEIYVYDRYGKLLKQIPLQSKSWDGLYRGYPKESNDYWYVITLRTGEQLNGHFTLKR
ncbi:T9SS type B sorting domain-containing protein [Bizionia sp. M204]|uniref:T9SS type B sorting domain-containing protein n=1 Tax=Bizionia sp. M204 TaxID=2675331 RepID=UPI002068A565|nr:T9SS type B sorting domain-containing protein [Bizionia sp. M204]UPS90535.1 T9SS type B sorting domain-containing protein [Bizionia sp. M204]